MEAAAPAPSCVERRSKNRPKSSSLAALVHDSDGGLGSDVLLDAAEQHEVELGDVLDLQGVGSRIM